MATNAEQAFELYNAAVGQTEGTGEWFEVTQDLINQFAEITEDRQFIHVDPELAAQLSPWKVTIAHGFLTLSMLTHLSGSIPKDMTRLSGIVMGVNYATLTCRRLGRVTETQSLAQRTVTLAGAANMPVYVGMAKGNLAWVELKRGEFARAERAAREGLLLVAPPYPVIWAMTFPLVAALFHRGETADSVGLLEKTLGGLQRLAPPVEAAILAVIAAHSAWDSQGVRARIGELLTAAEQHNYV